MDIEAILSTVQLKDLRGAAEELSQRYRENLPTAINSRLQALAYLVTRMPATSAVLRQVFGEMRHFSITSFLDLGAGLGESSGLAREFFPAISRSTLVERNPHLAALGKEMGHGDYMHQDLTTLNTIPSHDLVLLSYVVGELQAPSSLLQKIWESDFKALVIIEPGTPHRFEILRHLRQELISWGGQIHAPCSHNAICPMVGGDWCHFSVRLDRTFYHRYAKSGALGFEDEKFSYLVVSKQPLTANYTRILRPPQKNSGHVRLSLCTKEGLQHKVVSRKEGKSYKMAKKAEWGDKYV